MSKDFESIFEFIGGCIIVLFWVGIACGGVYLWNLDWNFLKASDKTEKWISLEKKNGYHTIGLDEDWAAFTLDSLKLEGKIRKPLKSDEYDFAYKMNAKLTQPKLESELENKIVRNYQFDFEFSFIDEDGFILYKVRTNEYFSLEHEKYANYVDWTNDKYPDETQVVCAAISRNMLSEAIVKRVDKIIYVPTLRAVIEDKEKTDDVFDKVHKHYSIEQQNEDVLSKYRMNKPKLPSSLRLKNKACEK